MPPVVHVKVVNARCRPRHLKYLGQLVPGDDAGHGRTSCGCGGCWERMRGVEAQITARYTVACVAAVVLPHAADAATDDAGAPLWRGWRECECTFSAQSPSGAPPWRSWSECALSVQVFLVCTALVPSPALTREEDGRRRAPLEWQVRGYSHTSVPLPSAHHSFTFHSHLPLVSSFGQLQTMGAAQSAAEGAAQAAATDIEGAAGTVETDVEGAAGTAQNVANGAAGECAGENQRVYRDTGKASRRRPMWGFAISHYSREKSVTMHQDLSREMRHDVSH
ncbi:hypothetical protein GGX14DRAFT_594125 [Mycena pura]|uniref:Uncharacterized protein n=1 Tax=Mycena pura TaxID=153505 RepID=A0AAD6UY39_9AGAR|nr:hypothetical protein GGX14DRAFT_594125 [Mycena pura]